MRTKEYSNTASFLQMTAAAVSDLRDRLQREYERSYPGLDEIIRIVLDEEEANAWRLSIFPHLVLPDLIEAHVERLGLEPADARRDSIWSESIEPSYTLAAAC